MLELHLFIFFVLVLSGARAHARIFVHIVGGASIVGRLASKM